MKLKSSIISPFALLVCVTATLGINLGGCGVGLDTEGPTSNKPRIVPDESLVKISAIKLEDATGLELGYVVGYDFDAMEPYYVLLSPKGYFYRLTPQGTVMPLKSNSIARLYSSGACTDTVIGLVTTIHSFTPPVPRPSPLPGDHTFQDRKTGNYYVPLATSPHSTVDNAVHVSDSCAGALNYSSWEWSGGAWSCSAPQQLCDTNSASSEIYTIALKAVSPEDVGIPTQAVTLPLVFITPDDDL